MIRCVQREIRNFCLSMHGDPIQPAAYLTLDFLHHQECRGKLQLEQYLGVASAKKLTCPLAPAK